MHFVPPHPPSYSSSPLSSDLVMTKSGIFSHELKKKKAQFSSFTNGKMVAASIQSVWVLSSDSKDIQTTEGQRLSGCLTVWLHLQPAQGATLPFPPPRQERDRLTTTLSAGKVLTDKGCMGHKKRHNCLARPQNNHCVFSFVISFIFRNKILTNREAAQSPMPGLAAMFGNI